MSALFALGEIVATPALRESETAAYLFLGPPWILGDGGGGGANWSQPMSQRTSTA